MTHLGKHSMDHYGWGYNNDFSGMDTLWYRFKGDLRYSAQNGVVLIYKKSGGTKRLLPLTIEDRDHITTYLHLLSNISRMRKIVANPLKEDHVSEALVLLKEASLYVSACDNMTIDNVNPFTFITEMIHIMLADIVLKTNYMKALLAVGRFLNDELPLSVITNELITLSQYPTKYETILDAQSESFCIKLDKYECFKRKTGICTFDLTPEQFSEYAADCDSTGGEESVHYCRGLLNIMSKNGTLPIDAFRNDACGHIGINDGQHRSCISKRFALPLPAQFTRYNSYCASCSKIRGSYDNIYYLI